MEDRIAFLFAGMYLFCLVQAHAATFSLISGYRATCYNASCSAVQLNSSKEVCMIQCSRNDSCQIVTVEADSNSCEMITGSDHIIEHADGWQLLILRKALGPLVDSTHSTAYGVALKNSQAHGLGGFLVSNVINTNHCQQLCEYISTPCHHFSYHQDSRSCLFSEEDSYTELRQSGWKGYYRPLSGASVTITAATSAYYGYTILSEIDLSNSTAITFTVIACNDAHVTLQSSTDSLTGSAYEFVFGGWGNSNSCIRRAFQGETVSCYSGEVLGCLQARSFWISWLDGYIQVGQGLTVDQSNMYSYLDPTPYPVNAVGVSTGFGSTGNWTFVSTP